MFLVNYTDNYLIGSSKYLDDVETLKAKYPKLEYIQSEPGIDHYIFRIPITDQELLEIAKNNSILMM
jgi:hypothetical protein